MAKEMIPADDLCTHYHVEYSFIHSLHEFGLIQINTIEERNFIDVNDLQELEKFMHLHYDLDINLEGIEAITHLLQRMKDLQNEMRSLQNKLQLYEAGE